MNDNGFIENEDGSITFPPQPSGELLARRIELPDVDADFEGDDFVVDVDWDGG